LSGIVMLAITAFATILKTHHMTNQNRPECRCLSLMAML
jgi:hypothetical protein